jgi:protein-tyrosine sulfotransferase
MARRAEAGEKPIFVVGTMRSGTTLMRLVLDSHENIAIAPETGFMRAVQANKYVPFWMWGGEWFRRLGVSEDELDRELAAFYGGFFRRYAEAQGKRRWGEKTPYHAWHLEGLARLWPDAVFVATVRHPGGNVWSLVSKWHMPFERAIGKWKTINAELVAQAERFGEKLLFCRYEELVLEAEPTLRELLERLGEPWSPSVLQHDVVHEERGTAAVVEGRTRSRDALDQSRVTAWTEQIETSALQKLVGETDGMARFFGYSFADVGVLEPLAPGRRIVTGAEIAARRADFPDVPEVQSPPVRPAKERMLDPDEVVLRVREPAEKRRVRRRRRRRSAATTLEHNGSRLVAAIKRRLARA